MESDKMNYTQTERIILAYETIRTIHKEIGYYTKLDHEYEQLTKILNQLKKLINESMYIDLIGSVE